MHHSKICSYLKKKAMKHTTKVILSIAFSILAITGCDTDALRDLNKNPNALNSINLNFFFTAAQLGAASGGADGDNRYIDWRTNIGMCSFAIQHLANAGGGIAPGDKYTHNPETCAAPFEFAFGGQGKQLAEIIKQTGPGGFDEGKKANLRQAARILRALVLSRATDLYGSIPYFDALQATNVGGTFFPTYNTQKEIYTDLLKELDEASAALSVTSPDEGFSAADLFYSGDIGKWKRFGYSLMLRMAMRISNVDAAMANTYVTKAVAGGVFTSNLDNVRVPMALAPSEWVNQNGISRAFYPGDGGQPNYLSKTLVDFLKGADPNVTTDDDPRLMIISGGVATWTPTSWTVTKGNPLDQKGMPNGKDQTMLEAIEGGPVTQETTYSRINFLMMQDDEPYMLMTYGEIKLLLAEAANRSIGGLAPAVAQGHYNDGVRASMQHYTLYDASLSVSNAAVDTYLATYPYVAGAPGLEMIGEQLWVNYFLNWYEAWSNWRRTGFPVLVPTNYPGNETAGQIPTRLLYPASEPAINPNFGKGSTTDTYTTKVWWAGGPE
jgi:Starch-binding associating with outer membrane